ncbi:MAG: cadherin-like domain-containing protein, partial [Planctomycetaceae bacterium]|nr:cadherin-like domain-containing protein [Planctomycetaceae bacterium]
MPTETLEIRALLSAIFVTNTNDSGPGSLRDAISTSNSSPVLDSIEFDIPGAGPYTIAPLSALPTITDSVVIDGWSQPGWSGTPVIELDGTNAGATWGLLIGASDTTVRGLVINRFAQAGIHTDEVTNVRVQGSYIGTDISGAHALPNNEGIRIHSNESFFGTDGDGLDDDLEDNLVSGNSGAGIYVAKGTDNVIAGNLIGTDAAGIVALANGTGISVAPASSQTLIGSNGDGLSDAAERNVISGNQQTEVQLGFGQNQGGQNVVAGNYIGTYAAGETSIGVSFTALAIAGPNNRIGTNGDDVHDTAERNVISGSVWAIDIQTQGGQIIAGNYIGTDTTGTMALGGPVSGPYAGSLGDGIVVRAGANRIGTNGDGVADDAEANVIAGRGTGIRLTSSGNVVAGNLIGTDVTGTSILSNSHGVWISGGAQSNLIGTDGDGIGDQSERNVISGSVYDGIVIEGSQTSGNVVAGNYLGTDFSGTAALGNGTSGWGNGVWISNGASNNLIGTDGDGIGDDAERNIISGNTANGVSLSDSGTTDNIIAGNFLGTDVSGTFSVGNVFDGVSIGNGAGSTIVGTNGDGIGDAAEANVVSGNGVRGITIWGAGTHGIVVAGNLVGTDATGTVGLGNGNDGIRITGGANENRIGTDGNGISDWEERNVISGNTQYGVWIRDVGTTDNAVAGNLIGTDITGFQEVANEFGVKVSDGAQFNLIGTIGDGVDSVLERNVISGNFYDGVMIEDPGTTDNVVAGNFLGTDVTGIGALGNGTSGWGNGVSISNGASSNLIGTDGDGVGDDTERNIISGNAANGISIFDSGTTNNIVAGNYVGTDVNGTFAVSNGANGIAITDGASSTLIGTDGNGSSDASEGNLISGNANSGIWLNGVGTNGMVIAGNHIGTDISGTFAIGNVQQGIHISNGVTNTRIGTNGDEVSDESERNVISGNGGHGIWIKDSGTSYNVIAGNYVGTDAEGTTAIGNSGSGLMITGGTVSNLIGTDGDGLADEAERNLISGNGNHGINIGGSGTSENVVAGNYIGVDNTGTSAVGNGATGVRIASGASHSLIGTDGNGIGDTAERNLISGNTTNGIAITNSGTTDNVVAGNFIGTDVTGSLAVANGTNGVWISNGATAVLIGTNGDGMGDEAERNVISGNAGHGVLFWGGTLSVVAGNEIGLDAAGTGALGNGGVGIGVANGSSSNRVGSDGNGVNDEAERNTIAFNGSSGVVVADIGNSGNVGNSIRQNSIHSNGELGIDLGWDGITLNDPGDNDSGPGDLQNFPIVRDVVTGAATQIGGFLNSHPNTTYTLDFYVNTVADLSGFGEGERYLGSVTVVTDNVGRADFDVTLSSATVDGEFVSATATDPSGNTSEFSGNSRPATPIDIDFRDNLIKEGATSGTIVGITAFTDDPDGDSLSYILANSANGRFQIDAVTGVVSVADGSLLDGPASHTITVQASDGAGGTATQDFVIDVLNADPVATDDVALANEGTSVVIDVLQNDSDAAGGLDPLTITAVSGMVAGTIVTTDGATVSYDPNGQFGYLAAGETATDVLTYTISDGDGGVSTGFITVTIEGVNDAPVVGGLTLAGVISSANKDGEVRRLIDLSGDGHHAATGQEVILTGTFEDADLSDVHTLAVDWGDGTISDFDITDVDVNDDGRSFAVNHVYEVAGGFSIEVSIHDGVAADTESIDAPVSNAAQQGSVLVISGSNGDDVITVTRHHHGLLKVKLRERFGGTDSFTVDLADVSEIVVLARGGDDLVMVSHAVSLPTV